MAYRLLQGALAGALWAITSWALRRRSALARLSEAQDRQR